MWIVIRNSPERVRQRGLAKNPVLSTKEAAMSQWRDFLKATTLGMAIVLAMIFVSYFASIVSTKDADAVYSSAERQTDEGLYILDLLVVRPVLLVVVAANAISYLPLALAYSRFGVDSATLTEWWLMRSFQYAFDRPLGDFDWKPSKYPKKGQQ